MSGYGPLRRRFSAAGMYLVAALGGWWPGQAAAAEPIRVLAAGAAQGAVLRLEPDIAAAGGGRLQAVFDTVGALRDRVLAGEAVDLIILSEAGIAALEKAGKLETGASVGVGSISVALAVRKGADAPDVSTPDALKATLLSARSIAHADPSRGATAGMHFSGVLTQLGIADEVKPRLTVLAFGGDVIDGVAKGRFEIGVSQSSEIVAHPGVTLAGSLPAPYARKTRYVAASPTAAGPRAHAVLSFLQTAAARSVFAQFGFESDP